MIIGETWSTKGPLREMVNEGPSMRDSWRRILYKGYDLKEDQQKKGPKGEGRPEEDLSQWKLPSDLLRMSQYFEDILSYRCPIELILFGLES